MPGKHQHTASLTPRHPTGGVIAARRIVERAAEGGRERLHEHEVYQILHHVGGIDAPAHCFIPTGERPTIEDLSHICTPRAVIKIVSPDLTHKSDDHGVRFCSSTYASVTGEVERMFDRHTPLRRVDGALVVECLEPERGRGAEVFVGVRTTREFGPVIAGGFGGTDTEFFARALRPERAVARAPTAGLAPGDFLDRFRRTAAYDVLTGRARGHAASVTDEELLRCFDTFIAIAESLGGSGSPGDPVLTEFEVNPFACRGGRLVPLDGRARLGRAKTRPVPRPTAHVRALLEPGSIAVLGVSVTNERGFGRIILNNVLASGFDPGRVRVIKPGAESIAGVACVPDIASLDEPVDLLVVAAGAGELAGVIDACTDTGKVRGAILIPGGAGETEGSEEIARAVAESVGRARQQPDGPVFLGPNSLGVQSRPGRYDTFFIPDEKIDKRRGMPHRGVALVSQSGAFIVSQLSNSETLDPAFAVSIGNQADLTLADLTSAVAEHEDIHTIGIYAEGFKDGDGLELVRVIRRAVSRGVVVVFYKAGRTASGRDAAAAHTASLAGDDDVCRDAAEHAGAIIADDFGSFCRLTDIASAVHGCDVRGARLGVIANAGCETVAAADNTGEGGASIPRLEPATRERLAAALGEHGLASLVTARNPLDLTPMAGVGAYESAARVLLDAEEIDALVISCIPLSPAIPSTAEEIGAGSPFAEAVARLRSSSDKPVLAVVDSGPRYEAFVSSLRGVGVPVLRSIDTAVRDTGRLLARRVACSRASREW